MVFLAIHSLLATEPAASSGLSTATIIAIIVAVSGFLTAAVTVYLARSGKRKTDAETSGTVVSTAVEMAERLTTVAGTLVEPLRVQLEATKVELTSTRESFTKQVTELKTEMARISALEEACEADRARLSKEVAEMRVENTELQQHALALRGELERHPNSLKRREDIEAVVRETIRENPELLRDFLSDTQGGNETPG